MDAMCRPCLVALAAVLSASGAWAAQTAVVAETTEGSVPVQSIDVLSFTPSGELLLGDGRAAAVFTVVTDEPKAAAEPVPNIAGFRERVAERLGTSPTGVEIADLAVHPQSKRVFVAVRHLASKTPVLVTVDAKGEIAEYPMDKVRYVRTPLATGDGAPVTAVTDVAWAGDRLVAAGRSNEAFASKIFVAMGPLSHDTPASSYSAETYHVAHGKWETKAPMSVIIPYQEGDESYIVGAFACTPVVKYPVSSLQPGAKVQGVSVIELGSGNRPLDMFLYEKGNKEYVLANTFRMHHDRKPFGPSPYWTVRFESGLLAETEDINEKALWRLKNDKPTTDRIQMIDAFHGVMQMAKYDDQNAVVLREREIKGPVDLEIVPLP